MRAFVLAGVLGLMPALAPAAPQAGPADAPTGQELQFEPQAQPPQPFPADAKIAFVSIQRIAGESAEGRAATAKVQSLNEEKVAELNKKNQELQAAQQKLAQSAALLSDQARLQLEREINRLEVDLQRFTQDAQAEVQDLQVELQEEFQEKLFPVINQVAEEMGLHMLFSAADSGLIWADAGLDITDDVIRRFDEAVGGSAGAQPPGAAPPQ